MTDAERKAVLDRIEWAKGRAMDAELEGDSDATEAWYGFIRGLRWVLEGLPLVTTPAAPGRPDDIKAGTSSGSSHPPSP